MNRWSAVEVIVLTGSTAGAAMLIAGIRPFADILVIFSAVVYLAMMLLEKSNP